MKRTVMIMAAAVAVFGATAPVSAWQDDDATTVTRNTPPTKLDKARELRAQAEALFSQPKQWKKAVRLLEQSAALREAADPDAYMCLLYAGRIQAALGNLNGARTNLEKAASHALARGSLVEAAHAYIDAAFVAADAKQKDAAQSLIDRATLLVESPLMTAEQKASISARLAG